MSNSDTTTEYRGPDVLTPLGEKLRLALGLDERPRTLGDWVAEMGSIAERDDIAVDPDVLCTIDESPHQATFDGRTQHYQCVMDPIILPFLADDVGTVVIETSSRTSDETIELAVTDADIDVDPADAVMSFGVAADVTRPSTDVSSPILAYDRVCPFGNAFPNRDEYEVWAANADAVTMAVSMDDALEVARAIGRVA